jgi:hypothetical protein
MLNIMLGEIAFDGLADDHANAWRSWFTGFEEDCAVLTAKEGDGSCGHVRRFNSRWGHFSRNE